MKGCIITNPGLQAVPAKEIKELIDAKCELADSVAVFETDSIVDFCTLSYRSQSASKVLLLFFSGKPTPFEDFLDEVKHLDLSDWVEGRTFAVRAKIIDNDDLDTMESERLIGEVIHEKYKVKANLTEPDVTFYLYVCGKTAYFGIDFAGFDLSKRAYRVFALSDSIKATVAYSLLRLAGYKKGMTLLDPFTHSGTIAIEAAYYATKKPVNFYNKDKFAFQRFNQLKKMDFDKFFADEDRFDKELKGITASDSQQRHLKSAEKNAKIAGANKLINFTRMEIEWLDTKFEKKSVDRIVSNPPKVSRLLTQKGLEKIFQELFYTADFILKPDGRIVLLTKNYVQILKHAQRHNFSLKANFPVWQGKEEFNILVFEKEKK